MSASSDEAALAQLLFGGTAAHPKATAHRSGTASDSDDDDDSENHDNDDDDDAGQSSAAAAADSDDGGADEEDAAAAGRPSRGGTAAAAASQPPKRKPAWNDDDDDELEVDISDGAARLRKLRRDEGEATVSGAEFERRLRAQFTKLVPAADWAKPRAAAGGGGGGANADFLRDAASVVAGGGSGGRLARGTLKVRRVKDANIAEPSQAVVQSVQWHPNASVVMTAGMDKKVRLFQLDGKVNRKIQTFHLDDLPVRTAAISGDGRQIICAGRRHFFYSIDLMSAKVSRVPRLHGCKEKSLESFVLSPDGKLICFLGNDGYLLIVLASTHRLVCTLKMNGTVRAAAFTPDSRELLSVGGDGEVYRWDLRQQRCLQRFHDEGNLGGTAIAVAPTGGLFAVGSTSGVVNVYDAATALGGLTTAEEAPRPKKALMNLTTAADFITFNHDASLLCMASRKKKDTLRMVHVDSLTTFSNWPTSNTPLHYVNAVAFSPHSGYLGVGNDKGAVLTYRLSQFSQA